MTAVIQHFDIATPQEIDHIVTLIESAYRGESGLRGWTTETHLIDGQRTDHQEIQTLMNTDNHLFLVGWWQENIVCCCLLERRPSACYFGMFAVSPDHQGHGMGKALLAYAEAFAQRTWTSPKMIMTVIKQRIDLIAWYNRRGYFATGETQPFPYGNPRAGLPKREDLVFLVLEKSFSSTDNP